jgi:hypothetical protein
VCINILQSIIVVILLTNVITKCIVTWEDILGLDSLKFDDC